MLPHKVALTLLFLTIFSYPTNNILSDLYWGISPEEILQKYPTRYRLLYEYPENNIHIYNVDVLDKNIPYKDLCLGFSNNSNNEKYPNKLNLIFLNGSSKIIPNSYPKLLHLYRKCLKDIPKPCDTAMSIYQSIYGYTTNVCIAYCKNTTIEITAKYLNDTGQITLIAYPKP